MLPESEWLALAKRLAVGMRGRYQHRNESRKNLVVGNDAGKWWAYCQACKEGGVVDKEHVRLSGTAPSDSASLTLPIDSIAVLGSEFEIPIARFLASKGMDFMYLPEPYYSPSRKRLLIHTKWGILGRDVSGHSQQKWLTYSGTQMLDRSLMGYPAVVVEDPFSYYKVRFALRYDSIAVLCALGTGIKDALTAQLLQSSHVAWMFDGDAAGHAGAKEGQRRMRPYTASSIRCAPDGKDPKDLDCSEIRALLGGVL